MSFKLLVLLNFALAAYLTGVIWTVQLVHYPGFAVAKADFEAYHRAHMTRMGWVVLVPMVLELLLAAWLAWQGRALGWLAWLSLALVLLIWVVTFFISVPFHDRLAAHGYDYVAIDGLVRTNWLRTVAWTARAVVLLYLLWNE